MVGKIHYKIERKADEIAKEKNIEKIIWGGWSSEYKKIFREVKNTYLKRKWDDDFEKEKLKELAEDQLIVIRTCRRCGGSGNYSYCQKYGSVCFRCNGRKYETYNMKLKGIKKWFNNNLNY